MNLILFDLEEAARALPRTDPRAIHILDVLKRAPGDSFDAGLIDGPYGRATLVDLDDVSLHLSFVWTDESPPLEPISLIVGMPRPQTARKVLEEATALGVQAIDFVLTEHSDPGYFQSRLWSTGEWRRRLVTGAGQAYSTRLPRVTWTRSLIDVVSGSNAASRLALDNYEATAGLWAIDVSEPVVLALGAERGWSERERAMLRDARFELAHLGERVLRVETACVAAVSLVRAKLNRM